MGGDILETVVLGTVLALCVAYVARKGWRAFSNKGGCCGCAIAGDCIREKIGPTEKTPEKT